MKKQDMLTRKTWDEFRATGLLWWVNMILHTFGWAITVEVGKDGYVSNAYPSRVKFRGFAPHNNANGYRKVANYIRNNANDIYEEAYTEKKDEDNVEKGIGE